MRRVEETAMTAAVSGERAGVKPLLTALAWSAGAVSIAAFAAAWVLAARNQDLLDISAQSSPDRFMVAYPMAGAALASRRPRNPVGWFLAGVGMVAALLPEAVGSTSGQVAYDVAIVGGVGLALPAAIGTAILKYRLYAIDRIISRTVSYALVTGLVVGVYLGCVALLSKVQPIRGSVGVAVSVLAAAALFNPVRRRVQGAVDRRFDRAGYDAERVVTGFAERLREEVDLDVLGTDLLGVVQQVLAPAHVSLWLHEPPEDRRPHEQERAGAERLPRSL